MREEVYGKGREEMTIEVGNERARVSQSVSLFQTVYLVNGHGTAGRGEAVSSFLAEAAVRPSLRVRASALKSTITISNASQQIDGDRRQYFSGQMMVGRHPGKIADALVQQSAGFRLCKVVAHFDKEKCVLLVLPGRGLGVEREWDTREKKAGKTVEKRT